MNAKHLATLELPKILARLAAYSSFSAGAELALTLTPACDPQEVRRRLETTSEARTLLDVKSDTTLGGAHDLRPMVTAAVRGSTLQAPELMDVRDTLISAHNLHRLLSRLEHQFPILASIARGIEPCPEIVDAVNRCLDERGNVRDDASPELARIRREMRIANERINARLQNIISAPQNAGYLQEALITLRDGRYVIPLKSDFKGRIRGVVHDVSTSGATVFIEPLSVVELNNAWREFQLQEEREVERILARLSALVAEHGHEIEATVMALAELDLAFAKARYAEAIRATAPELVPFRERRARGPEAELGSGHPGSTIRLIGARHPLLDPGQVVPIDVEPDDSTFMLIITGPNTGGKTVSLKTVGLLTVMAQAGLHIPAEPGSALSPFDAVYADIGDEQSIEQSLSTFSSHLTNIMSFQGEADERSLVLLDELGAGTDPAEGSALARALLDHFRARRATTFVATHYPELKNYAQLTPGVCNASVEFNPDTLSPTYRLTIGLPGRSNAFAIAQRLGLPREIVEAARRLVSPEETRTEDMLADIHRLRVQAARARDEATASRVETERLARELRARLGGIEQERAEVLAQARTETALEMEALRTDMRSLRRRLQAAAAPLQAVIEVEEAAALLGAELPALAVAEAPAMPHRNSRAIRAGDTVWVQPLGTIGQVLEVGADAAEVQIGPARTRVSVTQLELRPHAAAPGRSEPAGEAVMRASNAASPGLRLDLRGTTSEEALERLDRHLDAASRAALPWVHIIHGKGTGTLRRAVRQFLSTHPLVGSFSTPPDNEGGEGVTIATLVQS